MEINIKEKTNDFFVEVSGRIDSSTAGEFEHKLSELIGKAKNIVLNFKHVEYCSSAGLRTFVSISKLLAQYGNHLSIIKANEVVREVIDLTGLSSLIEIK